MENTLLADTATLSQDHQDVKAFLSASQPQYHAYAKGRRLRPLAAASRPSLANSGLSIPPIISSPSKSPPRVTADSTVPTSSIDSGLAGSLGSIERKSSAESPPACADPSTPNLTRSSTTAAQRRIHKSSQGPPRAFNTRINKAFLETHPSSPIGVNKMDSVHPLAMRKGTPCASLEMEPSTSAIIEEPAEPVTAPHHEPQPAPAPTTILPAEKVSQAFHAALTEAQTRENTMINTRRIPPNLDAINESLGVGGPPVEPSDTDEEDEEAASKVHWRQRLASHRTISQGTMTTTTSMLEDDDDDESDDGCKGVGEAGVKHRDVVQSKVDGIGLDSVPEKPTVVPVVTVPEPISSNPKSVPPHIARTSDDPVPVQVIKLFPNTLHLTPPQVPAEPILTSLPLISDLVDIPLNNPTSSSSTNVAAHTDPSQLHQEMRIVAAADTDLSYSSLSTAEFPAPRGAASSSSSPPPPPSTTTTVHTSSLDACPTVKVQRPPASKLAQTIHELMHQRKSAVAKASTTPATAAIDRRDSALARSNSSVKPGGMRETVARILQSTLSRPAPSSSTDSPSTSTEPNVQEGDVLADVTGAAGSAVSPNASVRSIASVSSRKSRLSSNASSRTKRRWWSRLLGGVPGGLGESAVGVVGAQDERVEGFK